jgi:hypothetical protein
MMSSERMAITVTGGCQCGAVRYRATSLRKDAHICHCRMCQKAVGGPFVALVGAPHDSLIWTRGRPAEWQSSVHAARGFCATCGTPLYYRGLTSSHTSLTIGALDDPALVPPEVQCGTEAKLPWMTDLDHLHDMGSTEENMAQTAARIATSNRQHPDHETPPEWSASA